MLTVSKIVRHRNDVIVGQRIVLFQILFGNRKNGCPVFIGISSDALGICLLKQRTLAECQGCICAPFTGFLYADNSNMKKASFNAGRSFFPENESFVIFSLAAFFEFVVINAVDTEKTQ